MIKNVSSGTLVAAVVSASVLLGALSNREAKAEDAAKGWVNSSGAVTVLNEPRSGDLRVVKITVNHGVNPSKGVDGLIFHIDLEGYGRKHVAIRTIDLAEYNSIAHRQGNGLNLKLSWSTVESWVKKGKKLAKRAWDFVDGLTDLEPLIREIIKKICELMGELGLDWCEGFEKEAGDAAVAVFGGNVKSAALDDWNLPNLHQKVAWSIQATLNDRSFSPRIRRGLVRQIHAGLIENLD